MSASRRNESTAAVGPWLAGDGAGVSVSEAKAEIRSADAKSATLLSLSGGSLALVAGILGSGSVALPVVVTVPAVVGVLALTGAAMLLILAIRPRLNNPIAPDAGEVLSAHLAAIALRKHQLIRTATSLLLLAMPALAGTALTAVLL